MSRKPLVIAHPELRAIVDARGQSKLGRTRWTVLGHLSSIHGEATDFRSSGEALGHDELG